ncbi:MAG: Hpt domain-containing protein [Deltaproteobacteria bacterium]|nr:Hpt domain-containing protein [Deltaproteobacteria bacterium]
MDNSQYKELFLTETNAHLADIEKGLLSLETPGDDSSVKGVIDDLFRHYHSIKGMCASMGYDVLKEFAHVQEGLLDSFRGSKLTPSPDVVGGLLTSLDAMKSVVDAIEADAERLPDLTEITSKVKALATAEPSSAAAAPASPIEQSGLDNEPPATKSEQKLRIPTSMRVEGKTFDELLRVTGDLLMSLSTLKEDIHKNGTI